MHGEGLQSETLRNYNGEEIPETNTLPNGAIFLFTRTTGVYNYPILIKPRGLYCARGTASDLSLPQCHQEMFCNPVVSMSYDRILSSLNWILTELK